MAATTEPRVFSTIEEALEDFRAGKFVVVVDAPDRENEGDLTIAAEFATPEAINFMATHGRGLICLCLTSERCRELDLRQMTDRNETPYGTAFTVALVPHTREVTTLARVAEGDELNLEVDMLAKYVEKLAAD